MRSIALNIAAFGFLLAACGQPAPSTADAQTKPTAPAVQSAPSATLSDADKTAILHANHLNANAQGLVRNECGDMVTPQFIPADVGLGNTILFVMVGGPNGGYTCYGDGPDLHLMRADGAAWREVWANRGGPMVILPTTHNGAHDLLYGGPGMTHSWDRWDGTRYAPGGDMADDAMPNSAVILPQ